MAYNNPSVQDFQNYFVRDFPYGTDPTTSILDQDISNSFLSTNFNISQGLFACQSDYTLGYLLLSAHYLVLNLRASSQGINGQYNFLQNSKGVSSVNEAFMIPQMVQDNPFISMLAKTNYGAQYYFLIVPQLSAACFSVAGTTQP